MPDDTDYRYPEEFYEQQKIKTKSILVGTKTIGTTPTEICINTTPLENRIKLSFFVEGDETIYIGNNGVTVSEGYTVLTGRENEEIFLFNPNQTVNLYAIAESNVKIRIKEEA